MTVKAFIEPTCRLCDSGNVELVVKLEPIPLSENYTADSETGKNGAALPGRLVHVRRLRTRPTARRRRFEKPLGKLHLLFRRSEGHAGAL